MKQLSFSGGTTCQDVHSMVDEKTESEGSQGLGVITRDLRLVTSLPKASPVVTKAMNLWGTVQIPAISL